MNNGTQKRMVLMPHCTGCREAWALGMPLNMNEKKNNLAASLCAMLSLFVVSLAFWEKNIVALKTMQMQSVVHILCLLCAVHISISLACFSLWKVAGGGLLLQGHNGNCIDVCSAGLMGFSICWMSPNFGYFGFVNNLCSLSMTLSCIWVADFKLLAKLCSFDMFF